MFGMRLISIFGTFYASRTVGKRGGLSSPGYHATSNRVYFNAGFGSGPAFEVIGADARSFEKLNGGLPESGYGRDKSQVFYNGRVIKGADPKSFVRLRSCYSMDDRFVYYNSSQLSKDPNHFVFIDDQVQKDRKYVYRGGWIISDDPEYFEVLGTIDGFSYYRDRKCVMVNGTRLPGANPATFIPLRYGYSHDCGRVYQMDDMIVRVIEGATPAGFDVFNSYYSHDDAQVFWKGKPLPGADPATFAILSSDAHGSREEKRTHHPDKMIPGLDPETFPFEKDCNFYADEELAFE
jgi:hypothetical protein